MDGETIWILIPMMIFSIPIIAIWTSHQRKVLEMQAKITAEKAAQYATGNSDLEERVRILERIVTDGGYNVAAQIEALRDTQRVDDLLEIRTEKEAN
jgi:tellurite resistance protein